MVSGDLCRSGKIVLLLIQKDLVKGKVLEIIMGDENNEVIKLGEVPDNSNNIKRKKCCCWK